jgi:hypothetical protein
MSESENENERGIRRRERTESERERERERGQRERAERERERERGAEVERSNREACKTDDGPVREAKPPIARTTPFPAGDKSSVGIGKKVAIALPIDGMKSMQKVMRPKTSGTGAPHRVRIIAAGTPFIAATKTLFLKYVSTECFTLRSDARACT